MSNASGQGSMSVASGVFLSFLGLSWGSCGHRKSKGAGGSVRTPLDFSPDVVNQITPLTEEGHMAKDSMKDEEASFHHKWIEYYRSHSSGQVQFSIEKDPLEVKILLSLTSQIFSMEAIALSKKCPRIIFFSSLGLFIQFWKALFTYTKGSSELHCEHL